MFEEKTYISAFDVMRDNRISVRKTTNVLKNGSVIASNHWRCVLVPNDPQVVDVLNEQFYLDLANFAWSQQSPETYVEPAPASPDSPPPVIQPPQNEGGQ
jgi:hypothetical protein